MFEYRASELMERQLKARQYRPRRWREELAMVLKFPAWPSLQRLVARPHPGTDLGPNGRGPAPHRVAKQMPPGQETPSVRIMVVDDTADVREMLHDSLELEGYTVEAHADAAEALNHLSRFRPQVMLLDLFVPGLSGLAGLRQIRDSNPEVGVITVMANRDHELATRALTLGAFDYVTKPIDFACVKQSIETFLLLRTLFREEPAQGN